MPQATCPEWVQFLMRLKLWLKLIGTFAVIAGVEAALLLAPPFRPIPRDSAKAAAQSRNDGQRECRSTEQPSSLLKTVITPVGAEPSQPHGGDVGSEDKQQQEATVSVRSFPQASVPKQRKLLWDYVFDWGPWVFNLGLFIVGGLQVFLLIQTRREIHRQADTMEQQAEDSKETGKHTETLALQAVRQSDLTQRQLELTHRPWIAIEAVLPASDLMFDERGGVLTLSIQVRNVGNSIAKHVLSFVDYAVSGITQMPEVTARVTAILKQPTDPERDHGKLLFPGQADISQIPIIILPKYIDQALKSGHFKDQKGIAFDLLVCFDYQSTIDPGIHHQTRCTFGVAKTPSGGGPLMGIFVPSARVYPAQQIVIFYRGFGAHVD
jgi:hypothetical protein